MLRRLYPHQPESFAFTPDNQAWAEAQITKFPEGRQASAIIPILWRAQEQEGWLTRPAIEAVADMLGLAHIRALEVATFYFMFQLQPVGSVAHVQVCGTTSCMICGAEDLIAVCRDRIAPEAHALSADGKFSWEEVECLGACANAPMAQIGKDYYEDLTAESFAGLLDDMAAGRVPVPGSQTGRFASEPANGLSSLRADVENRTSSNASTSLAADLGDTLKRIDGSEVPLSSPWQRADDQPDPSQPIEDNTDRAEGHPVDETGISKQEAPAEEAARPEPSEPQPENTPLDASPSAAPEKTARPALLSEPREGKADDLTRIKGIGPKLQAALHGIGVYHFDQIASWSAEDVGWVDANLIGFKGRIDRDGWIVQAKAFAEDRKDEGT